MELLRFITAGNVDDGKSTLIGRLLYDSDSVSLDVLNAIEKSTKNKDNGEIDLSLLTDGLRAEREQGITIDVAYKYFNTPRRKFIIADTPGHVQYTRNMVTGASNADLAIILIDARHGITEQTQRHSIIASLLRIPHLAICINKMDLVAYSQKVYDQIIEEYRVFSNQLEFKEITYIPVSAAYGDNVVSNSENLNWYKGKTLLAHLEEVEVENDVVLDKDRFQVQYVIRPQTEELHDYRGYAGKVNSGTFKKGDRVKILPSGIRTVIEKLESNLNAVNAVYPNQAAVIHLKDAIDISRGDTIVKEEDEIETTRELEATLCWMSEKKLKAGDKFILQHNSKITRALVQEIEYKIDVNTLKKLDGVSEANLNDIVRVKIKTAQPLTIDSYKLNRNNGGFILVDETSNATVAAGINEEKKVLIDLDFN